MPPNRRPLACRRMASSSRRQSMINRIAGVATLMLSAAFALAPVASAQQKSAVDDLARYRELLQDRNPAALWELRGEPLWKTKGGPKKASLEQCDLGKVPGC